MADFRNIAADIGLSLDPASYNHLYSPGPAVLAGTALNTFGRISELEKRRKEEAKNKADVAAVEHLIGVPFDFFKALPAENQADLLEKAGLGTANPKKQKIPWLDNATLEDIQGQGLPPVPEKPPVYGPVPEGSSIVPSPAVPGKPPIPPGLTGDALGQAVYARTGTTPPQKPLNDLQQTVEALNKIYIANLLSGKTREGGTPNPPGGRMPKLTAAQSLQIKAWLARPENAGKTEADAALALFGKGGQYPQQTRLFKNPDGSIVSDLDAQPGAIPMAYDKTTNQLLPIGQGGQPTGPVTVNIVGRGPHTFPNQAALDEFNRLHPGMIAP